MLSYQQTSWVILLILKELSDIGIKKISTKINLHEKFYQVKEQYPDLFKRLYFDTNGHTPYSEDLDSIVFDYQTYGLVTWDGGFGLDINSDRIKKQLTQTQDFGKNLLDFKNKYQITEEKMKEIIKILNLNNEV